MKKICETLKDTEELARRFVLAVKDKGAFVSLYGPIGAGKTAFVKFAVKALNVKERVTSPSFVILNEYKSGEIPVYHFDLYRLEKEGIKTILDELREYSEGKILTFVEWAEFLQDEIPFNHIKINVEYCDDDSRQYSFEAFGEENIKIIKGLK